MIEKIKAYEWHGKEPCAVEGQFHHPVIDSSAWVHETAVIIGEVKIAAKASVWPGAVVRGDVGEIVIGEETNIQDLAVLHPNQGKPVLLGKGITVGHSAVIHGSEVGEHCLIGMGAIVIDSTIGEFSLIGAGALITPGSVIPPKSMVMGIPGKVVRELTDKEIEELVKSKETYSKLTGLYKK
jgi:carbonic anhydrase/acetyltransferase-like protein (isoleucine patch superfamily)